MLVHIDSMADFVNDSLILCIIVNESIIPCIMSSCTLTCVIKVMMVHRTVVCGRSGVAGAAVR